MTAVWAVELPAMEKLVLLALADCANDEGHCWPSAVSLARKCGQGERTVRRAIHSLILKGHLSQRQRSGTSAIYTVHPCQSGSTVTAAPLPDRPETPARAAPKPSGTVNTSKKDKPSLTKRAAYPPPPGVPDDVWSDYLKLRRDKRAGMSATAYARQLAALGRLAEDGWPPGEIVALSVERGWTGFFPPKEQRNERTDSLTAIALAKIAGHPIGTG